MTGINFSPGKGENLEVYLSVKLDLGDGGAASGDVGEAHAAGSVGSPFAN